MLESMKRPPTDLEILKEIYNRHYDAFAAYSTEVPNRATKIYVPIDLDGIGDKLGVDADIVFGRLYYHLNHKYGYRKDDGLKVNLFTPAASIIVSIYDLDPGGSETRKSKVLVGHYYCGVLSGHIRRPEKIRTVLTFRSSTKGVRKGNAWRW